MACKGVCVSRYAAVSSPRGGGPYRRYADGYKRCQICMAWVKWDGRHCPCCNGMLRARARYRRQC